MAAKLTLLTQPGEGRGVEIGPGQALTVGRARQRNALYAADPLLAPVHFAVEHRADGVVVRDLSPSLQKHPRCAAQCFLADLRSSPCAPEGCGIHHRSIHLGLHVNRAPVHEARLQDGDVIVAGGSCFGFSQDAPVSEPPLIPPPDAVLGIEQQDRLLTYLAQLPGPLFAMIDAARHPAALAELLVHEELYYSLYDGVEGTSLDGVAPYLVELPNTSSLLQTLIREHWGRAMFSLIVAQLEFKLLRRHLRRFLMVKNEQGEQLYFRFYDPRVLRVFLPTCTPNECTEFFGPILSFIAEGEEKGTGLQLTRERSGSLRRDLLRF